MGPIDYSGVFAAATPHQSVMTGFKDGVAIQQYQVERAKQQAALTQQKAMQAEMAELAKAPTVAGVNAMMLKYPQLAEPYEKAVKSLAPEELRVRVESAMPAFQALRSGKPEIAAKVLREQATAYRNAGKEKEAAAAETKAMQVEDNPQAAQINLSALLSAAIGPDKFAKMVGDMGDEERKQGLHPDLVRKGAADADGAVSDATTKRVTAKYADRNALADLEKKGWDIKKIQADIVSQRETNRIAAMTAAAARESNQLKREELRLKIADATRERDDKVREKVSKVEGAVISMDNMLNTVERLLANDELDDVLGSLEGRIPGVSDREGDAVALIDQLGSQAFLSQVPNIQGMGALSNAEGEKLQAALQNFSRSQSEGQFRANLKEVQRLVKKGRESVSKRYGVPVASPDTPAAPVKQGPVIPAGWSVQER